MLPKVFKFSDGASYAGLQPLRCLDQAGEPAANSLRCAHGVPPEQRYSLPYRVK
jgi:hypothetical protein